MSVEISIVVGALAGLLGGGVVRSATRGELPVNIAVGIAGALAGGWLLSVEPGTTSLPPSFLGNVFVSLVCAAGAIAAVTLVRQARLNT